MTFFTVVGVIVVGVVAFVMVSIGFAKLVVMTEVSLSDGLFMGLGILVLVAALIAGVIG